MTIVLQILVIKQFIYCGVEIIFLIDFNHITGLREIG